MTARAEATIEAEIEQIRRAADLDGRPLTVAERGRLDALAIERAAAYRHWDGQRRATYLQERRGRELARLRAVVRPSPIFLLLIATSAVSGFLLAASPSDRLARPLTIVFILSAWIASVCVHEFGHALAGYLGGDLGTAERGALSLDPRRYTNRMLSIALPLVFLLLGGIGLPGGSVYVDRRALRSRRWGLLVSLAGPLGTLFCLLLASLPFLVGGQRWITESNIYFWAALAALVKLLAIVLVLNLLPVPPLDGFRILSYWLPAETVRSAFRLGWKPLLLLYMVLGYPNPIGNAFWQFSDSVALLLRVPSGLAEVALRLLTLF